MQEMLFNLLLKGMNEGFVSINYVVVNRMKKQADFSAKMEEIQKGLGAEIKKPHHFFGDEALF